MKSFILFLCVISLSFFCTSNSLLAYEIGNNLENDIANDKEEINIEEEPEINLSNSNVDDIFGDEQTFPFVAGLGKNAAHWKSITSNIKFGFQVYLMKGLRVLELSEALNVDSADLLAICAILKCKASSRLSILSFEECKRITDYYEKKNLNWCFNLKIFLQLSYFF